MTDLEIAVRALQRLGGRCETFTGGSCRIYGRTIDADQLADRWCDACIANDALEAIDANWEDRYFPAGRAIRDQGDSE